MEAPKQPAKRPLTRERIVEAAMALADDEGLHALSMRKLAGMLGVEAMSLYNHVANKDDLLGGVVDSVLSEIPLPNPADGWRTGMRIRAEATRAVFLRHPWALGLLERHPANSSPARLQYYDAILGTLRAAGFSARESMQAFSIVDSYIYGHVLQEIALPFDDSESLKDVGDDLLAQMADAYPHLTEATIDALADGWDHTTQFVEGLDLVLTALDAVRGASG